MNVCRALLYFFLEWGPFMPRRQKLLISSLLVPVIVILLSCAVYAAVESSLAADNIRYNINTKIILASGNVVIKRDGATLWGDKAEGSTDKNEFWLRGGVKGDFPQQNAKLASDELKWFRSESKTQKGYVEAFGNVRLTRGENERLNADYAYWEQDTENCTARGRVDAVTPAHILKAAEAGRKGEAFWGKKVARYENREKKIGIAADAVDGKIVKDAVTEAVATGNVVMDSIDEKGLKTVLTGKKAVYSKARGTIVVSGGAKAVRSDGKTVVADTLVFYEETNDIEALGNSRLTFLLDEKSDDKKTKDKDKTGTGKD